jgi:hypothetical protein
LQNANWKIREFEGRMGRGLMLFLFLFDFFGWDVLEKTICTIKSKDGFWFFGGIE